ncbi:MAG: hydrogenase maturation protease [Polyangiaceae bacterium]|nr:hydrogenase maturation protease [Polyangiaceae bacterium]
MDNGACRTQGGGTVRVTVVCAGNELGRDDGIGIRVGRVLRRLDLPDGVEVRFFLELGWELLDLMRASVRVVVVDATCFGRRPGTCSVSRLEALEPADRSPLGCHGLGLPLLAEMARQLSPEAALPQVTLVGIEAERLDGFSTELSPSVREALPKAVGLVLSEIGASAALVAAARELGRESADWEPAIDDVQGG